MIMTGAAAGLAAAFNTPLGGIVFAVEELSKIHIRYFRTALFSAVIIAGLTAQGLLGPYLYLGYPNMDGLHWYVILIVIIVAIVAGLGGSGMAKLIVKIFRYKGRFTKNSQHLIFLFCCAMLMAVFSYFITRLSTGSGKEIMTHILFSDDKKVAWYLPLLRFTATIASFTVGGAGGVFAPSLAAGASVGSVMAGWFHMDGSNANILILAGMVAFLTGITRSPFTSAILVLEMTDRHNVIFHLMVAAMVANLVSLVIDRRSLYDHLKEGYLAEVGHEKRKEAAPAVDD
jgi:H+/Cl- antiporter ClcA